uniref:DUF3021 family protein n=1 Tax=Steinernema glaseri TaxID=37863 RepID=A0A1I7YAN1_9BILA
MCFITTMEAEIASLKTRIDAASECLVECTQRIELLEKRLSRRTCQESQTKDAKEHEQEAKRSKAEAVRVGAGINAARTFERSVYLSICDWYTWLLIYFTICTLVELAFAPLSFFGIIGIFSFWYLVNDILSSAMYDRSLRRSARLCKKMIKMEQKRLSAEHKARKGTK